MLRRSVVTLVLLAVAAQPALAKKKGPPKVGGTYQVTFARVADTCGGTGLSLDGDKGQLAFEQSGRRLVLSFPMIPILKGSVKDNGSFDVFAKRGRTAIAGLDGEYRVSGMFAEGKVDLVLVVKYWSGDKPYCEQSFTGTGAKQ